jgi:hypothetical protein
MGSAQINPYADVALEWRSAGSAEFRGTSRMYVDTLGAKRIQFEDLVRSQEFVLLRPDHFIGMDTTKTSNYFFALPKGKYEVRAHYHGRGSAELNTQGLARGITLPQGDFFSNIVSLEITD